MFEILRQVVESEVALSQRGVESVRVPRAICGRRGSVQPIKMLTR